LVLQLHRVENIVHVRGRAAIELRAQCSRCLEEVELAIDTPVEVALFPELAEPPAASDGELRAEDMGVATYADDTIDLGAVIHDEVFLELPMSPVCTESCLGLCPSCGQNRNEQPCACELPVAESGWKLALRNVKLS
jgi:uncharacterized protein